MFTFSVSVLCRIFSVYVCLYFLYVYRNNAVVSNFIQNDSGNTTVDRKSNLNTIHQPGSYGKVGCQIWNPGVNLRVCKHSPQTRNNQHDKHIIKYSRDKLLSLNHTRQINDELKATIAKLHKYQKRKRGRRAGTHMHKKIQTVQGMGAHDQDDVTNNSINDCDISLRPRFLTSVPRAPITRPSKATLPSVFVSNAQSVVKKFDEIEVVLSQNNVDICIITETWFRPNLPVPSLNIATFNMFDKSRQHRRGGGVAIYLKNNITVRTINEVTVPEELECTWVMARPERLPRGISSLAICAVYITRDSPHQQLLLEHLNEATDVLRTAHPDIGFIIAGDFNRTNIDTFIRGNGLKQIVKFPTRGEATLDFIITNLFNHYNEPQSFAPLGKSDHSCILLNPIIKSGPNKIKTRTVRPIKDVGIKSFGIWIQNQDWAEVFNSTGVQNKTDSFYQLLNNAVESHFPMVTKKLHVTDQPWITPKIKKLITERQKAFQENNTIKWRRIRNKIKRLIDKAKTRYYTERVRKLQQNDIRSWHQQVKVMTRNNNSEVSIHVPGVQANKHDVIANAINDKFVSVSSGLAPLDFSDLPVYLPAFKPPPCLYPWDVYNVLRKLNVTKATGPDGIPPRLVKEFAYELSKPFTDILNSSYVHGIVPSQWKKAIVIPIPKQHPANIDKLRPVSLTDCFAKVSEGFIVDWVLNDIQQKIDINQYGNVKGVSTAHYLVSLMHFLHKGADTQKNVGTVVITDFSKAFDLIDHTLLIKKFMHMGVRNSIIPWICSFISNRQQCVRYNQTLSDFKFLNGGLPQGTKMGPLGFQVIINDAASGAKSCVWKYVDDLTLAENSIPSKSILQQDLDDFVQWSRENNLILNPSKCQGLQICFMRDPPTPNICIDYVPLEFVNCAKILGIWIQGNLKWDKQISEMLKKVNCRLFMLRTLKKFGFNKNELSLVYKGYVRPLLEYGDVVWNSTITLKQVDALEKVQKRACRIIFGRQYTSYKDVIDECGIDTLSDRRQNHCLKFAKSLQNCSQTTTLLPPTRQESHGRDLRNSSNITQLSCRTSRFRESPVPYFIDLLNS